LATEDEIDMRKQEAVSLPTEVIWQSSGIDGNSLEQVAGSNQV
jgi:hypothetical protein